MPKRILALFFVCLLLAPSFAALKVLENPQGDGIVKIGEDISVPLGTDVKTVVAIHGNVNVAGTVKEDVVAVGGKVTLEKTANVIGNVVSIGGSVEKAVGASVKGDITEVQLPVSVITKGFGWGIALFSVMSFIAFLVLAAVLVAIFGKYLGISSYYVERQPGHALLWGLLWCVLIIPIIVLMVISIIGIPFIPLFLLILASACVFGYIAAAQLIGKIFLRYIRQYNRPMMAEVLTGLVLLFIISLLPVFGWIVKALFGIMGLGATVMTRFGTENG